MTVKSLDKDTFFKGMKKLTMIFPRTAPNLTPEMLDCWFEMLAKVPDVRFKITVIEIIQTKNFFPSLAEIYQAAKDPFAGAISDQEGGQPK